jgi:hypothetical protein
METSLTRTGYLVSGGDLSQIKKQLTVRPVVNGDFGYPPPPFKVFKPAKNGICIPRFFGIDAFGTPQKDKRPPPTKSNAKFVGQLRDATHQNAALAAALNAGHGVLSLPCGYGKTTVSLAIACKLGYRTMIIVHKQFLADQWKERIQQFCPGATIGIVQQDKKEVECDFIIAMLQSLSLKEYSFSDFDSVGTLIVDEAHHICAKVFSQSLFKMLPQAYLWPFCNPRTKRWSHKSTSLVHGSDFFCGRTEESGSG